MRNVLDATQTALENLFLHLLSLQNVHLRYFNLCLENVTNDFTDTVDAIIPLT